MGGLSSGEGLIFHVRDPIEKIEAIKEKNRPTGEYETVIIDHGVEDKRLTASESEFSSVLKVGSRDTNILSPLIRQAWDGIKLQTLTKNNPMSATGAHISILGHTTKDELIRYLNDTETANGFANRILWPCVRRAQILPEGGGQPDYRLIVPQLHEALELARNVGEVRRNEEARLAWREIYEDLSEGKPGLFGSVTARAEAQVLRISVIYAALDGSHEIQLPHLEAALAVWEYAERSAAFIFGDATGDPVADRILEGLKLHGELNRTQISNVFQRNVKAERITQALGTLLRAGRVHQEIRDTEGRPAEIYTAA
jgi:hypothetical protein